MKRASPPCLALLVVVVTALAYLPSLGNGFTNWDDNEYLTDNPAIKRLTWPNVGKLMISVQVANYHPLTMLAYAAQYRFFGARPRGYHAVSLGLHLANCLLALWVLLLLSGSLPAAAAGAFLFGVHPLHVESVAWISEQKDVLSTFFFLAALAAYLGRPVPGPRKRLWLTWVLFLLSLLAKSMAVTFPLVMILCDWLRGRRLDRGSLSEKIPFFLLAAVFGAVAVAAQRSSGAIRAAADFPLHKNLLIAAHGLVFYLVKAVLPLRLSALYPYPAGPGEALPPSFLLAPILVALLAGAVLYLGRRTRTIPFGALFTFVTLLPVLQLVPLGNAFAADRYLYIPSLGLCYLAGLGLVRLGVRLRGRDPRLAFLPWVLMASVIMTFAWLTFQRTRVWRDSLSLWSDVLDRYPGSALAYNNRGNAHADLREYDLAMADYRQALRLNPDMARAYYSIGNALSDKKDFSGALAYYGRAVMLEPDDPKAYYNRGIAYLELGEFTNAAADCRKALELKPGQEECHNNLGLALAGLGRTEEAASHYREALRLNPAYTDALVNLGIALARQGRPDEAVAAYRRAIAIEPGGIEAHFNLGVDLSQMGRRAEAAAEFREVLRLDPGNELARSRLMAVTGGGLP